MAKKPEQWITVNGVHIPIMEGESKGEAIKRANSKELVTNPTRTHRGTEQFKSVRNISKMKQLQEGGNVDLFKRPKVDASELKKHGWQNAGEGTATVFTSTYTNEKGDKAGNFTPIQANEKGEVEAILTEEELTEYAEAVLAGEIDDYLGLQVGRFSEGENALEDAEKLAELIHELQEEYYLKKGAR